MNMFKCLARHVVWNDIVSLNHTHDRSRAWLVRLVWNFRFTDSIKLIALGVVGVYRPNAHRQKSESYGTELLAFTPVFHKIVSYSTIRSLYSAVKDFIYIDIASYIKRLIMDTTSRPSSRFALCLACQKLLRNETKQCTCSHCPCSICFHSLTTRWANFIRLCPKRELLPSGGISYTN